MYFKLCSNRYICVRLGNSYATCASKGHLCDRIERSIWKICKWSPPFFVRPERSLRDCWAAAQVGVPRLPRDRHRRPAGHTQPDIWRDLWVVSTVQWFCTYVLCIPVYCIIICIHTYTISEYLYSGTKLYLCILIYFFPYVSSSPQRSVHGPAPLQVAKQHNRTVKVSRVLGRGHDSNLELLYFS